MSRSYDYYQCEVCKKVKPKGSEKVREIAFSQHNDKAQWGERGKVTRILSACMF